MDSDNLFEGLNMFTQGIKQLQTSRSLMKANDAVNQIKDSELDDHAKTQQLRSVAQGLTYQLASLGVPAGTIQSLSEATAPMPKSTFEAYQLGGDAKNQATAFQHDTVDAQLDKQRQAEEAKAKAQREHDAMWERVMMGKADQKTTAAEDKQTQSDLTRFQKDAMGLSSLRSVAGDTTKIQNRFSRVEAALSAYKPGDKIPEIVSSEVATGMAAATKGSPVTAEEVNRFIPKTAQTDTSSMKAYIESHPNLLTIPEFVKIYKSQLYREHEATSDMFEKEVLKVANTHKNALQNPKIADVVKAGLASQIDGAKPSDIIINQDGQVSWTKRENMNRDTKTVVDGVKKAKIALNSKDPTAVENAKEFFNHYGLDSSDPMEALERTIKFNVRTGKY